jgi:hypothetical protein
MGCGSSSEAAKHRREAEEYAKRKKMGFKDPGLEKFRKDTVKQKKKLRHVDDPYTTEKRKQKQADIKTKQKKEQHTADTTPTKKNKKGKKGKDNGGVAAPLTEDAIQAQRKKLKHVNT